MAATIATLVKNVKDGADLMANTESYKLLWTKRVRPSPARSRSPTPMYTK